MVLLRESGMAQPAIAAAMGVSLSTVNRAHMACRTAGHEYLPLRPEQPIRFAQRAGSVREFGSAGACHSLLHALQADDDVSSTARR